MPVLTCGGMRFQHKWEDIALGEVPAEGQKNLEAIVAKAIESGINHFETARGYGSSELQLGLVLPKYPREKLIIQTKVAPDDDAKKFRANFEKSLKLLRTDYVDLLALHGLNDEETLKWSIRPGGCVEEARKIQSEGKARFIGFSTHGSTELITKAIETGAFDYVNLHWYFANELNWKCVEAAERQDMGLLIISPNDKGGKLYEPTPLFLELCKPLHPMQFNALFCLLKSQVHTLSIGASRPEDFDLHLEMVNGVDRANEIVEPIVKRLRETMKRELGFDWSVACYRDIPEWENFPNGINIKEIVRLWSFAKSFGMLEFAKMRYNLLGNASHWFPGNPVTDFEDAEILEIVGDCPIKEIIPSILRESHEILAAEQVKRLSESE